MASRRGKPPRITAEQKLDLHHGLLWRIACEPCADAKLTGAVTSAASNEIVRIRLIAGLGKMTSRIMRRRVARDPRGGRASVMAAAKSSCSGGGAHRPTTTALRVALDSVPTGIRHGTLWSLGWRNSLQRIDSYFLLHCHIQPSTCDTRSTLLIRVDCLNGHDPPITLQPYDLSDIWLHLALHRTAQDHGSGTLQIDVNSALI